MDRIEQLIDELKNIQKFVRNYIKHTGIKIFHPEIVKKAIRTGRCDVDEIERAGIMVFCKNKKKDEDKINGLSLYDEYAPIAVIFDANALISACSNILSGKSGIIKNTVRKSNKIHRERISYLLIELMIDAVKNNYITYLDACGLLNNFDRLAYNYMQSKYQFCNEKFLF